MKLNCLNCNKLTEDVDYLGFCKDCIKISIAFEREMEERIEKEYERIPNEKN